MGKVLAIQMSAINWCITDIHPLVRRFTPHRPLILIPCSTNRLERETYPWCVTWRVFVRDPRKFLRIRTLICFIKAWNAYPCSRRFLSSQLVRNKGSFRTCLSGKRIVYGAFIRRKKSVLDGYVLSKIVICSEKTDNQSVLRKSFGTGTTSLMRYGEGICPRPGEIPEVTNAVMLCRALKRLSMFQTISRQPTC